MGSIGKKLTLPTGKEEGLANVHNPEISFQKSYESFHVFDDKRFAENSLNVLSSGVVASKGRAEAANPTKLAVGKVRPLRLSGR